VGVRRVPRLGQHLKSIVLLGGEVRASELSRSTGRSLLDLPVRAGVSILDHWRMHAESLASAEGLDSLSVRVMINAAARRPATGRTGDGSPVTVTVEHDSAEYSGTGGVLRELGEGYDDDDVVLVATAGQVLLEPLTDLFDLLVDGGGDINLISHADGSPVNLILISCRALKGIPDRGFLDFKEQALPELAKRFDVRVVPREESAAAGVKSRREYLTALWMSHRTAEGRSRLPDPFHEDWAGTFGIVERGASADPAARIHDSVVLAGARVGAGATLVRSVVCRGAFVRPGAVVCDSIVEPRRARGRVFRR
jgi:hypothetical protein